MVLTKKMSPWLWQKLQQFYVDRAPSLALSIDDPPLKQKTLKNMRCHKAMVLCLTSSHVFPFTSLGPACFYGYIENEPKMLT